MLVRALRNRTTVREFNSRVSVSLFFVSTDRIHFITYLAIRANTGPKVYSCGTPNSFLNPPADLWHFRSFVVQIVDWFAIFIQNLDWLTSYLDSGPKIDPCEASRVIFTSPTINVDVCNISFYFYAVLLALKSILFTSWTIMVIKKAVKRIPA